VFVRLLSNLGIFYEADFSGNIPNGGISNFGTIIIQGFGFSTLVTTLMQVRDGLSMPIFHEKT
jgi:hypothetical protein